MPVLNYDLTRTWGQLYPFRLDHAELADHPQAGQKIRYGRAHAYFRMPPFKSGLLNWHLDYWRGLTEDYRWTDQLARAQAFLAIPQDAHVLFVGAAFGWLAEAARSLGWTSLACTDDSNWIHDHKADLAWRWNGSAWVQDTPNAVESILQIPLSSTQQLKNALKSVYGTTSGEPDWIITESVLAGLLHQSMGDNFQEGEGDADELTPFLADCDAMLAPGGTVVHLADVAIREPFNIQTLPAWRTIVDNGGLDPHPNHRVVTSAYYWKDWEIL